MHTRLTASLLAALLLVGSTSSIWAQTPPSPQPSSATPTAPSPQPTAKAAEPTVAATAVTPAAQPTKAAASPTAAPAAPAPTKAATVAVTPQSAPTKAVATAEPAPPPTAAPAAPVESPVAGTPVATATPKAKTYTFNARVFEDADGDRICSEGMGDTLSSGVLMQIGDGRQALTDEKGEFRFGELLPGRYEIKVLFPEALRLEDVDGYRQWIEIVDRDLEEDLLIARAPVVIDDVAAEITGQAATASEEQEGEQMAAMVGGSLQLKFAPGRDTLAQITKRGLNDNGVVWLGVPFITQMDGTLFQSVNCGPASLAMVLAAFGLQVGPDQVRNYLNSKIHNFDTNAGTGLDVLANIAREAGLQSLDLYANGGGYRRWSTDAVRWHISQGHPVITLVKYRDLPGHGDSAFQSDHYVVITGLTPTGFIYNDAAFSTTLGYGLEISNEELEVAWDNSSIPRHSAAMALNGAIGQLSFPETAEQAPVVVTPEPPSAWWLGRLSLFAPPVATPAAGRPLAELVAADQGASMNPGTSEYGLDIEQRAERVPAGLPAAGEMAGRLLLGLGGLWLLVSAWSIVGALVRFWRRPPAWARALSAALLQVLR